ncbi:hypothetical protein predicted by Glimmer/Critica [Bartonella tribocorum CIP 105476]|uniref:Uncharacterized protein n=1 Tax=Bartonella tribocorum (strain DSM 28219 / CCUG 45778 / CIP 105476 / IBS 506) TaxID=382640 RepID=A9IWX0_BART1|nr:hypothetical protein predicted by Glimmer/Critica [Bartonella tribocorum CIP 105476]
MKIGLHLYAFNIFPKLGSFPILEIMLDRYAISSLALWHIKEGTVFKAFIQLNMSLK